MKALLCGIALAFALHGVALASDKLAPVFPQGGEREVLACDIDNRER